MINLGCGDKFHENFVNVDLVSSHPKVIICNFLNGIPFADNDFDFAYHSHVLEHFSKDYARVFLQECYRILKPGGVLRIAVPDLENIVRNYLQSLEAAISGAPLATYDYDWMMLELYDQFVRSVGGGNMGKYLTQTTVQNEDFVKSRIGNFYNFIRSSHNPEAEPIGLRATIKRLTPDFIWNIFKYCKKNFLNISFVRRYNLGKFRENGENHQWMYDRFSLSRLLLEIGFTKVTVRTAQTSELADWASYELDTDGEGNTYKKDSLFIEAIK